MATRRKEHADSVSRGNSVRWHLGRLGFLQICDLLVPPWRLDLLPPRAAHRLRFGVHFGEPIVR